MSHPLNSLGLAKPPAQTRVVVAMSGGVDSSVVAAMLHEEGYEVVGITLQLYDHGAAVGKKGACCAGQDIQDARRVADKLGIPHYVLNYESKFKDAVMDDFVETYLAGQTPIPCVKCNQSVKFKDLLSTARELGADVMATGHYVQRKMGAAGAELHRGIAQEKDQSYFLFATTPEQLDFLRFPLGGKHKEETRQIAERFGLEVSDKPDSQDICFVPEGGYASVIEKLRPGAAESGEIVHVDGRVLGTHHGIIHYTVGQRRGLGIAAPEPLYVVRVDAEKKQVIVGPYTALLAVGCSLREVNWLATDLTHRLTGNAAAQQLEVMVKLRSAHTPIAAQFTLHENGQGTVIFAAPHAGIAPGQACVMYHADRVLGGGWITQAIYPTWPANTQED